MLAQMEEESQKIASLQQVLEQSETALASKTKEIEEQTQGFEQEKQSLTDALAAKETS